MSWHEALDFVRDNRQVSQRLLAYISKTARFDETAPRPFADIKHYSGFTAKQSRIVLWYMSYAFEYTSRTLRAFQKHVQHDRMLLPTYCVHTYTDKSTKIDLLVVDALYTTPPCIDVEGILDDKELPMNPQSGLATEVEFKPDVDVKPEWGPSTDGGLAIKSNNVCQMTNRQNVAMLNSQFVAGAGNFMSFKDNTLASK